MVVRKDNVGKEEVEEEEKGEYEKTVVNVDKVREGCEGYR